MRSVLSSLAALALAGGAVAVTAAPPAAAATVITVGASGAEYTTIQAAVNAVPDNSQAAYTISVAAGTYAEHLTIPATKLHLTLQGATGNPSDVHIDGSRAAGETDSTGTPYGDLGSATVTVLANDFTAEYVSFRNTFNRLQHPSITGTQALAIAMRGDRQAYYDCVFYGHQDTVLGWTGTPSTRLRQYIYGGEVEGDVDFIFGDTTLVVDRSYIKVLNDGIYSSGSLAAPATYSGTTYGILITGSTVASTLANNTVYLARAWDAYSGAVPQMVVRNTSLPAAINVAAPWTGISGATWTPGRYGEFSDSGPGATINANRPQLSATTAADYTAAKYLYGSDGWNPIH